MHTLSVICVGVPADLQSLRLTTLATTLTGLRRSRRRRDTVKEKTDAGADNAGNREDGDKTASGDGDAEVEVIRPAKAAPADSDEDNLAETA